MKAIKPDLSVTWPLLGGPYEKVIAATYEYDKHARRPSDKFGAEMRSDHLTVLIPNHVITALNALPPRHDVHPDYFFWSGNSKHKPLTGRWHRKLERLNDYVSLRKDDGTPMKFHSHQLRDTFAMSQLLSGTSMQDLSKMLSYKSVRITEKYY